MGVKACRNPSWQAEVAFSRSLAGSNKLRREDEPVQEAGRSVRFTSAIAGGGGGAMES